MIGGLGGSFLTIFGLDFSEGDTAFFRCAVDLGAADFDEDLVGLVCFATMYSL